VNETQGLRQRTGKLIASDVEELARKARRRLAGSLALLAAFLVALLLLINVLFGGGPPETNRRTSFSARADGFRGLFEVLSRLGYSSERHRLSYGRLPPPESAVLVIVDPLPAQVLAQVDQTRMDASQIRSLKSWIARGGRVLAGFPGSSVVSLLGFEVGPAREQDEDVWARVSGAESTDVLSGILDKALPSREWIPAAGSVSGSAQLAGFEGKWSTLPEGREMLAGAYLRRAGGREITRGIMEPGTGPVEITGFNRQLPDGLESMASLDDHPILASREEGKGEVWLLSSSYPFTNLGIAVGGTGPFLAAVADQVSDGGTRKLFFDEYVHGLWPRRGALGWVFQTSLLYPGLACLFLFSLLAWRGAIRLGPAMAERRLPRRAKEEFVMSLADIALRARRYRAAARWILEAYRSRLAVLYCPGWTGGGEAGDRELPVLEPLARRLEDGSRFREKDLVQFAPEAAEAYQKQTTPARQA
jgi:hypothetical protein